MDRWLPAVVPEHHPDVRVGRAAGAVARMPVRHRRAEPPAAGPALRARPRRLPQSDDEPGRPHAQPPPPPNGQSPATAAVQGRLPDAQQRGARPAAAHPAAGTTAPPGRSA